MNPITMKLVVDDLILQALREDITFEAVSYTHLDVYKRRNDWRAHVHVTKPEKRSHRPGGRAGAHIACGPWRAYRGQRVLADRAGQRRFGRGRALSNRLRAHHYIKELPASGCFAGGWV